MGRAATSEAKVATGAAEVAAASATEAKQLQAVAVAATEAAAAQDAAAVAARNVAAAQATGAASLKQQTQAINGFVKAGGAITLFSVIATQVNAATKEIERMALAFDAGKLSAGELTAEVLKSIPAFGQLVEAGDRIFSLATGETQYIARIKEATAAQERHMAAVLALRAITDRYLGDAQANVKAMQREIDGLGLTGIAKQLNDLGNAQASAADDASARAKAAIADANASMGKDISEATQKLNELRQQLARTDKTVTVSAGTGAAPTTVANPDFKRLSDEIASQQAKVDAATTDLNKRVAEINAGLREELAKGAELGFKRQAQAIIGAAKGFGQAWADAIGGGLKEARDRAQAQIDALKGDLAKFGKSDDEKALIDFKAGGLTPGVLVDQFKRVQEQMRAAKANADASEEVNRWRESLKGPIEQYDEAIAKLRKWRDEHRINQAEFDKGVARAKADLGSNLPRDTARRDVQLTPFLRSGADVARLAFQLEQGNNRDAVPEKQLAEQKQHSQLLRDIKEKLDLEVR
jgi:hypothetical protein